MRTAEIVLDYMRALIWPALIIFVVVRFRGGIADFARRIAGESREFSASAFGLGITARFQEQLESLAEQSDSADPEQLRESVKRAAHDFAVEQFYALTANFARLSLNERREAAETLEELTSTMAIDDLLRFVESDKIGERTGAAIGLGVHLELEPDTVPRDRRVIEALRKLLRDRSTFVTYRAAQAARKAPEVARNVEHELRSLTEDDNPEVRTMAGRALRRARL